MTYRSIKSSVAAALALSFLVAGGPASADTLRIGGTGVALGGMRLLGAAFETHNPGVTVEVLPSLGSSGGVKALLADALDLSVISRPLKDKEKEQGAEARLYATTPLAIVTSKETQTDGITTAELAQMYAGTLETWPSGERVRVVLRPASETDVQILRNLSDDMAQAVDASFERPGLSMATNDQNNAELLETVPGSVGAIALGQIATEDRHLKVLTLDGILPTLATPVGDDAENSGTHRPGMAFSKSLYLVQTPGSSPTAQAFAAFVFSPDAQALLQSYDHVVPQE